MIGRIFWIGVNTIVEFIRDRSVTGFLLVGFLFIMGGYVIADMSFVEKQRMYIDAGLGSIFIVGIFITLLSGTNVIDREIRERQALCALAKPIPRFAWVIGKLVGFLFTLGLVIFILTTFLVFFIKFQLGLWIPLIYLGGLLIYLEMIVLTSYILFFSMVTSQYLCLFFSLIVLIVGHLSDDLKIYWASASTIARYATRAIYYALPDLETYHANPVVTGQINFSFNLAFWLVFISFLYLAISVIISTFIFSKKELA